MGKNYKGIRKRIAERFANIDITVLPDKAFEASVETALLVATEPIPHDVCQISYQKVDDTINAWKQFEIGHKVSFKSTESKTIKRTQKSFASYELSRLWNFLTNYPRLKNIAELHRGIQWNLPLTQKGIETGNRSKLIRDEYLDGFIKGVAPQTKFNVFESPNISYLNIEPQNLKGTFKFEWSKPKAILNKSARARGHWRIAAFPDTEGVAFYQTFIGVWSKEKDYDEFLLAAILNSPIANAFVSTREGKTDITIETLKEIPIPQFTKPQISKLRNLIKKYQEATNIASFMTQSDINSERLLKKIDALVLNGYGIPPRLERQLLDFFDGYGKDRRTSHKFDNYFPPELESYFSLSEYLSPEFEQQTFGKLVKQLESRVR